MESLQQTTPHEKIQTKNVQNPTIQRRTHKKNNTFQPSWAKTLTIVSLNPDNLININKQNDILHELQKRKVHIAAIQDTHIPHGLDFARNGYRIITSEANPNDAKHEKQGLYHGGVAIIIHTSTHQHIHQIARIDHRILKTELKSNKATSHITILTSYAPRKCYKHEIRDQNRKALGQVLPRIPRKHLCIWCADANGQLGNRSKTAQEITKIVGQNTMAETTEKGNGKAIRKLCIKHEMLPMNTWRRTHGQTKRDPIETATWISPDGKVHRQIDYIAINQEYRKFARWTHTIRNWRGNMEQQRQHASIKMEIQLNFKKRYFYRSPVEERTEINYIIKHAKKKQPGLLGQHIKETNTHKISTWQNNR